MPDFAQMETEFAQVERGDARLSAIRDAIHEADQRLDLHWQFWFRYDYLEESIFCGDRYCALIIFPELLRLYDDSPALQEDEGCSHSLLIAFKWIVEAAPEFPQISRSEIDGYFQEFRKRLRQQGKSLSIYYMKRCLFYMHVDRDIAAMQFYRFLEAPLDDISDGKALYYDQQTEYYLSVDEEEKALQAAKPIFEGKLTSNSLPQSTYCNFIRYYLRKHDLGEAMRYARLTEPRVNGDPYYHDIIGALLTLYSQTDLPRACKLFSRNYPDFLASKNPWLRVHFAVGASHLFDCLEHFDELRLPPGEDPAQVSRQLHQTAQELCRKFDERNGTHDYMQMYLHPFGEE